MCLMLDQFCIRHVTVTFLISVLLYTITINFVTTGAQKCLLSVWGFFCFICSKQCIIIICRAKVVAFSSAFKKMILKNTTPTFQEEGGVTQLLIFC